MIGRSSSQLQHLCLKITAASGLRSSTSALALNSPAFVLLWHWAGGLLWPDWVTEEAWGPPDTCWTVLGKTPQSFRETWGEKPFSCRGFRARMLIVIMKLLIILSMQKDVHNLAFQIIPCRSILTAQTNLAVASPRPTVLLGRVGSASQICSVKRPEVGTACHTTPQLQISTIHHTSWQVRLVHLGKKGKATKTPPHTEQSAARIKDYCITFLCCIQGFFGLSSLPDLIYHDYPPSSVSELISSWDLNSQNYSYTCTWKKNLNMHTLSK